jgi:hypothetical protein
MQPMSYRLRAVVFVVLLAAAPWLRAAPDAAREAARLNNLGTALMNQQFLQKAADEFAQAYAADPKLALAKINEGLADLYLQKLPEAHKALDVAAEKAPRDPHTWYALGLLYRSENDPHKALEAFNKAKAIDPADADTHYLIASIDLELNDYVAAVAEFRKALGLNPLHASAEFGLARGLQRLGKADEAKAAFARFQHITSGHLGAPLSHNYGEEGRYARVEDAALADAAVGPMIPVTFAESWQAKAGSPSNGAVCVMEQQGATTLVVMGSGDEAVRLFRGTGPGEHTSFEALGSAQTGIQITGNGTACAVGDYDNDGLPDLAVAVDSRVLLLRNLGNGRFEDVTQAVGLKAADHATSLTFVDYDHDGDLDLFVTGKRNTLWRNNGNNTFTDWTHEAGFDSAGATTSAVLSDLNNDRAVDLITTGSGAPVFYANRREGPFAASPLYDAALSSTVSIATLDFNKDGWMDVLLTHSGAPGVSLWRNVDGSRFERVALPLDGVLSASAAIPIDFDNDGWIDLAMLVETASGTQMRMLRNMGPTGFVDVSAQLHLDQVHLSGPGSLVAADFSRSGAAGLLVTQADGSVVLLGNVGGNRNHSLRIALKGTADNKSGIGTKVEVFANGLWQKWEANGQSEILAGLGKADHADVIRLLWPTGVPQDEIVESAAQAKAGEITEIDRRGSSCPTLFAWDGKRYTFVSDAIGAAVVGHWVSPTQHNIPDPDEWIKVSEAQLREHDGRYSLRFGEPMEEVNFVDQVRLVAVDHPSATAVFPNEGFLSEPPFAESKTIAASSAHGLAGAWDDHGKDVAGELRERDQSYVRDFTNLPFAGFANTHTLTLDLGAWSANNPLRLLLYGFIEYFSASSMYSAWQAGLAPIPPFVEAQGADGSWHRIVDDMGFPAGLPRTVVFDLTGKLPADARRIRITTNLQIYWDQIQVDNEAADARPRQTELPLAQAKLAFRGYPEQSDGKTPGDLSYDYERMSATGPFIPHRGAYTRYGDVTPLLRAVDDEFVIFGTGEDMDLEFSASTLPALSAEWTRDFFFYANGFVKDMDFYEASPFQVGALPFHGMSGYPYPANEHYPDDAAHTAYQLEYNTRWEPGVTGRAFQFDYQPRVAAPDAVVKP